MEPPLISVVMPVYNSRRFVAEAVKSILNQTFRDFELIIIDDGSRDGTAAILETMARQDCRVTLIHQANMGVSAASNRGLALARGEFYARMDHDDIAMPQRLALQLEFLRSHPECVAVGGQVLMIDADGFPLRVPAVPQTHEEIEKAFTGDWAMFHPTLMARTEVMRELGGYSLAYAAIEDLDIFMKLAERGRLANLPEIVLRYRQHFSSICHTRVHEQLEQTQAIFRDAAMRRGQTPAPVNKCAECKPLRPPPKKRHTQWSYEKMWAWWALAAGYGSTARRHAIRALRLAPLSPETWLLLWCALRGY